jgi:hypothetical protein
MRMLHIDHINLSYSSFPLSQPIFQQLAGSCHVAPSYTDTKCFGTAPPHHTLSLLPFIPPDRPSIAVMFLYM